jgi:SpoVK/Ycf46/Vps4 family AAA+-type ATPase
LYGLPGTGKTEYIKQLAKLTKRDIYQVDISNIKDLWVGNSEKNLKLIFNEYNQVLKTNKKTPILLFNEADAILGKRINVSSSVDQVFNSLQNILLQELEDFNGIFVATTNNITNIDNAFDRRFVFKIQLQLPNESTRYLILKENFPEINDDVVLKIARLYKLSGGQITNIKKRILLDTLVRKSSDKLDIYFEKYVIDETKFRKNNFEIGFKLN